MALPLAPLVQINTGEVHPDFPPTLLNFWLLTDPQLESLASFYHQRTRSRWTYQYPCPITWRSDVSIEEKRRKIGKFIGLRGCDTPTADAGVIRFKTEDEIAAEATSRRMADDNDAVGRKTTHYF